VHDKCLHLLEFRFEPGGEITRAVLEENDEAKREKNEERDPKEAAQQRHVADANLLSDDGQRGRHHACSAARFAAAIC
jgi:hypothetical protein